MDVGKPDPRLVRLLEELLQGEPDVAAKKMFGSQSYFARGQLFASVLGDELLVRLGESDRAELLGEHGAHTFEPMPGRPMREYVVLPPKILKDKEQAAAWVATSLAYARSLPAKEAKPKKRAPAKSTKKARR